MEHVKRDFQIPEEHFFLFGPRGTGKSTLLKKNIPNSLYIDLLQPDLSRMYAARPERLLEAVHAQPEKRVVVIDEIQKIPDLLPAVHSLIEEKQGRQFILTGSSARKLRQGGINLLGGRALQKRLHPFSAWELNEKFSLTEALETGLIPVVFSARDRNAALSAYIDLYIRQEVMMEGWTRNIGNFSRFLESISFSHGSILNLSNVSRECQVERKIVESYVTVLEDLLVARKLNVFSRRAQRQVAVRPKFYFFDTGLFRKLRPKGPLDAPGEIEGPALEGMVLQHLQAFVDNQNKELEIYFWRTRSGSEVDFILYGEELFCAIEVKNTTVVRPSDLRALKTFLCDYPRSRGMLVYRGREKLKRDHILILPCEDFLRNLPNHLTAR
ncbi:MAG: ATP-binding protein [Acidobacteriota bacterium]|jgi:predicted AAA+ superfamily ATPase|nr:ATP-binding protein [Acidobacteriota bacterium]